ncbi:unnamed protein product, partial [Effrenium voratum]
RNFGLQDLASWLYGKAANRAASAADAPVQLSEAAHRAASAADAPVQLSEVLDAPVQAEGIFSGCVILVWAGAPPVASQLEHCCETIGGTAMSLTRKRLLEARVRECGGRIAETFGGEVTHLVVGMQLPRTGLHFEAGGCFKVTDSWLCESLLLGKRLPEQRYLWRPLSEEEQTSQA